MLFDDFFIRAMIGCVGIALAAGPLGCIVVWRRMAYFGETLAHSSLLGVALAFIININMTLAVFIVTLMLAAILLLLQRNRSFSSDSLLGILSHASLAVSLVILSFMPWVNQELSAYLFGDILAVSKADLVMIWGSSLFALVILYLLWRPLFAATVSLDIAEAEGMKPEVSRVAFMFLLALVIALAMKIVGILLITALLIIPAATARRFAITPASMAVLASVFGVLASIAGLLGADHFDTPSGPSIVVAAFIFFIISLLPLHKVLCLLKIRAER